MRDRAGGTQGDGLTESEALKLSTNHLVRLIEGLCLGLAAYHASLAL